MEPEPASNQYQKLKSLEHDLNDLRQGLVVVTDYCRDLKSVSKEQLASLEIDEGIIKPLMEDELEFEGIWSFHEDILVADPQAHVPCAAMYEAFIRFCTSTGRRVIEQEAFEFIFARMENPKPICERGEYIGYRLRSTNE